FILTHLCDAFLFFGNAALLDGDACLLLRTALFRRCTISLALGSPLLVDCVFFRAFCFLLSLLCILSLGISDSLGGNRRLLRLARSSRCGHGALSRRQRLSPLPEGVDPACDRNDTQRGERDSDAASPDELPFLIGNLAVARLLAFRKERDRPVE